MDIPEEQAVSNNDLDFQVQIHAPESKTTSQQPKTDLQKFQEKNLEEAQQIQNPHKIELDPRTGNSEFKYQVFHILFKFFGLMFFFILSSMISSTFAFIIVVILDAFDFWTVKNVSGRKLVGLRWWSEIRDDGQEIWLYESMDANYNPNECNSNVFWFVQSITTLLWAVLTIIYLITLQLFWCLLAFIGLILSGLNFIGFYKCRGEHQKKAKELVARLGMKAIQRSL